MEILLKYRIVLGVVLLFSSLGRCDSPIGITDIPALCLSNTQAEISKSNGNFYGFSNDQLTDPNSQNLESLLNKSGDQDRNIAPWLMQDGDLSSRTRAGYLVQLDIGQEIATKNIAGSDFTTVIKNAALKSTQYSADALKAAKQVLDSIHEDGEADQRTGFYVSELSSPLLCAKYLDTACPVAFDTALHIMHPVTYETASLSLKHVIKKLETDPTLVQGAAIFASKILERMNEAQPDLSGLHLFDELKAAYISAGLSPRQAEKNTWIILGFYGARGPSMTILSDIVTPYNLPLFLSLYTFSAALGTLDHLTVASGHPYSLPSDIQSNCYYGRPYHFWLSAYLAHDLVKHGVAPRTAMTVAHLAGKIYEFAATTVDRTNPLEIYSEKPMSDPVLSVQKNVAFNIAGASWGSDYHPLLKITDPQNPDENFMEMIAHARPLHLGGKKEDLVNHVITRYSLFDRLTATDAVLERLF